MSEATKAAPVYASAQVPVKTFSVNADPLVDQWVSKVANGITVGDGLDLFQAEQSGWYSLSFTINYQGAVSTTVYRATLRIIGAGPVHILENLETTSSGGVNPVGSGNFGGSYLVQMAAGDKIHFTITFENNISHNISGYASLVKVD